MSALEVRNLTRSFGALRVTRDVTLAVEKGARTALIGPNGAGKTTLVNLITGALRPDSGQVLLDGRDISRLDQPARARLGLVRTFQITRLFKPLSVEENIRIAVLNRLGHQGRLALGREEERRVDEAVAETLATVRMQDRARSTIAGLAYGEQRLVELALALALKPKVLLLDEPAAGVPQSESHVIMSAIAQLPGDLAVVFIEHDMDLVFRFARRIVVLVGGAVFTEGAPAEVAADEEIKRIYFGEVAP